MEEGTIGLTLDYLASSICDSDYTGMIASRLIGAVYRGIDGRLHLFLPIDRGRSGIQGNLPLCLEDHTCGR